MLLVSAHRTRKVVEIVENNDEYEHHDIYDESSDDETIEKTKTKSAKLPKLIKKRLYSRLCARKVQEVSPTLAPETISRREHVLRTCQCASQNKNCNCSRRIATPRNNTGVIKELRTPNVTAERTDVQPRSPRKHTPNMLNGSLILGAPENSLASEYLSPRGKNRPIVPNSLTFNVYNRKAPSISPLRQPSTSSCQDVPTAMLASTTQTHTISARPLSDIGQSLKLAQANDRESNESAAKQLSIVTESDRAHSVQQQNSINTNAVRLNIANRHMTSADQREGDDAQPTSHEDPLNCIAEMTGNFEGGSTDTGIPITEMYNHSLFDDAIDSGWPGRDLRGCAFIFCGW